MDDIVTLGHSWGIEMKAGVSSLFSPGPHIQGRASLLEDTPIGVFPW